MKYTRLSSSPQRSKLSFIFFKNLPFQSGKIGVCCSVIGIKTDIQVNVAVYTVYPSVACILCSKILFSFQYSTIFFSLSTKFKDVSTFLYMDIKFLLFRKIKLLRFGKHNSFSLFVSNHRTIIRRVG